MEFMATTESRIYGKSFIDLISTTRFWIILSETWRASLEKRSWETAKVLGYSVEDYPANGIGSVALMYSIINLMVVIVIYYNKELGCEPLLK